MGNGLETESLHKSAFSCIFATGHHETPKDVHFYQSVNYPVFLSFSFYTPCFLSNSIPFGLLPKALPLQGTGIFLRSRKILSHTCRRRETVAFVVIPLKSTEMKKEKNKTGGKPPKPDKATHCIMVRFNSEEFARFLTLYEQSGVYAKAVFIKSRVFGAEFRVLKVDKTLVDYYTKLSALHAQYRAIGVNYNQTVRELKSHFSEKKAMALLFRLEKQTVELIELSRRIIALTNEFQQQWLPRLT